jgi:hypothetical protein
MLADDLARDHGFPWSATRRLAWSDFEGEPPAQDDKSARTAYGLFYGWHCRGHAMTFSVITGFRRRGSWVKPLVHRNPAESARVLRHEQTHFDIAEVYARRMRRTFAALENPCGKSDGALHAVARDILEAEKTEQRRYDAETRHSLVIERQQAWERDVARLLESLDRYAR